MLFRSVKVFCGKTHSCHPIQLFVRASSEQGARMNIRYRIELSQTEGDELKDSWSVRIASTSVMAQPICSSSSTNGPTAVDVAACMQELETRTFAKRSTIVVLSRPHKMDVHHREARDKMGPAYPKLSTKEPQSLVTRYSSRAHSPLFAVGRYSYS